MSEAGGWDRLLDPDERIIWQGRPSSRVQFEFHGIFDFLFVLAYFATTLYVFIAGPDPLIGGPQAWYFGYLLVLGFYGFPLVCGHFWRAFKRSRTSYALTTKRAFISYRGPMGHRLNSYHITQDTPLQLKEGRLNAVWFGASEPKVALDVELQHDIGFERLADPHAVYQLFQSVQRGTA